MRFYSEQHRFYCSVDLHTRSMLLCILDKEGKIPVHRKLKADPEAFLTVVKPYSDGLVVFR